MNLKLRIIGVIAGVILSAITCSSLTLEQAKAAFNRGDYSAAAKDLSVAADKAPKNAQLNFMAGKSLWETGRHADARKYLERGSADGLMPLAQRAADDYQFDDASYLLELYRELLAKNKKKPGKEVEEMIDFVSLGQSMIDRVEKIEIIDSIVVPRTDFFKYYKLSKPSGHLSDATTLPDQLKSSDRNSAVYNSENGEMFIWATDQGDGKLQLMQSHKLTDGTWEQPTEIGNHLGEGGNAAFPYLMSDGLTLYFAADGNNSLGGYDIFITRSDGERFLQPQNVGMPYNSPYDDYMLAIDEVTGIGWWATDRNQIADSVTIYLFIPNEVRENYSIDDPDIVSYAKVRDIKSTQGGKDFSAKLAEIHNLANTVSGGNGASTDFEFAMPGGKVYTSMRDFKNRRAAEAMRSYLEAGKRMNYLAAKLAKMREIYRNGKTDIAEDILATENEIEGMRQRLKELSNDIVKLESNK